MKKLFGRNCDEMGETRGFLQLFMLVGGARCWNEVLMFQSRMHHHQRETSSVLELGYDAAREADGWDVAAARTAKRWV